MNKRIGAKSIAEIKKEFETADRTERKKLQMLYASDADLEQVCLRAGF